MKFSALVLLLVSHTAFAMPHDQPSREIFEKGTVQIQVYRSPGLASAHVGEANARSVQSILVCKSGRPLTTFKAVREVQGSIVGLSKTAGVVLTSTSNGTLVSLDIGKLKMASATVKMNSEKSGINSFEIDETKFSACAKKTDRLEQ